MLDWLVLTASLPTSPSGLGVRIRHALEAAGILVDSLHAEPRLER